MARRRRSRQIFAGERRRPRRWPAVLAVAIGLLIALLLYALLVDGTPLNELL